MNKTILQNTIRFLERTELRWNEAPAFMECIEYIQTLLNDWQEVKI